MGHDTTLPYFQSLQNQSATFLVTKTCTVIAVTAQVLASTGCLMLLLKAVI